MKLILLGPPGAGKGTQAVKLSEKYSIPTISTGHMIRTAIATGTEMGKVAQDYISRGALLPDETVVQIVQDRLREPDTKNGYILDGFPRTLVQAEMMEKLGIGVDRVLSIEVPDETLVARLSGRRSCMECGATYHIQYNPPKSEGICDQCGEKLTRRDDDDPEVIRQRLMVYHAETEPLISFYQTRKLLVTVIGQEEVTDTTALVYQALETQQ